MAKDKKINEVRVGRSTLNRVNTGKQPQDSEEDKNNNPERGAQKSKARFSECDAQDQHYKRIRWSDEC